jgi:hypothetical protein
LLLGYQREREREQMNICIELRSIPKHEKGILFFIFSKDRKNNILIQKLKA